MFNKYTIIVINFLLITTTLSIEETSKKAIAVFNNGPISGQITFIEKEDQVLVEGTLSGIGAGLHGFHVHEKGDLSNGCVSAGGHFNPEKKQHGGPDNKERHVGDLGNISANSSSIAVVNITDAFIKLDGAHSIIGRALVIHEGEDDLGLGGHEDSLTTGHAGGRLGCTVIGLISSDATSIQYSYLFLIIIPIIKLFL